MEELELRFRFSDSYFNIEITSDFCKLNYILNEYKNYLSKDTVMMNLVAKLKIL